MCAIMVFCALLALPFACSAGSMSADLVLRGGQVVSMADSQVQSMSTAVAVVGERIVYVGDDAGVEDWIGVETRVVELDGAVVIPGLIDGHAHLYGLGKALCEVNLRGSASEAECVERAVAAAADLADGEWLQGRGWDQNNWRVQEFPNRVRLDAVFPQRPVMLRRIDGHAAWLNSAALRVARITAATVDPEGGRIVRDAAGEPTGVLVDNAADLVADFVPPVGPAEIRRRIEAAVKHCLRLGLTGVHEAGAPWQRIEIYREMAAAGDLHLRLYEMLADDEETLSKGLTAGPFRSDDGMFTLRTVKLFADGALGSRGALLLADYSDDPGNRGLAVSTREHLKSSALRAGRAGFQVSTHAIGDAANRLVLDVYEEALAELELEDARWRIEHAQILDAADIPRFAELGIIASMQPVHCTSDMDWAADRLGDERCREGAYMWCTLLESGAHVSFGTDFPVEKVDPLEGLYSARTRQHHDGKPSGGWHVEECLNARAALHAYSGGVAYTSFDEDELGVVEVGRLADLTVLSGNPVDCGSSELLQMQALMTIVGGKVKYSKE